MCSQRTHHPTLVVAERCTTFCSLTDRHTHRPIDESLLQGTFHRATTSNTRKKMKCLVCQQVMALTGFRATQAPKLLHIAIDSVQLRTSGSAEALQGINGDTLTVVGAATYDLVAVTYDNEGHFRSLIRQDVHSEGDGSSSLWMYDGDLNGGVFTPYTPRNTALTDAAAPSIFPYRLGSSSYYANALIYVRRGDDPHPDLTDFTPVPVAPSTL